MTNQNEANAAEVKRSTEIIRPLVVFDMDGVLADFVGAACKLHDACPTTATRYDLWRSWRHPSGASYEEHDFWGPIHDLGVKFWRNMPRIPTGVAMLRHLIDTLGVEVVVATDDAGHPGAIVGKRKWFALWIALEVPLIFTREKHLLAQPGRLLIDDNPEQCRRFREAGGDAWLWPQPWNTEALAEEAATWREVMHRRDQALALHTTRRAPYTSEFAKFAEGQHAANG